MSESNDKFMDDEQIQLEIKKVRSALQMLVVKTNYNYIGAIAKGAFGIVLKLERPNKTIVAAKFVSPEEATWNETNLWKSFDHPNVLPLHDVVETFRKRIFLMPFYSSTLWDFLQSDSFCAQADITNVLQVWIADVLKAVQYLHDLGVCHMDIKHDNVLATREPKAVLCDFGFVTNIDTPVSRYGLPAYLKPPESCLSIGRGPGVDGRAFDVWSVGQLAFFLFTRKHICEHTDLDNLRMYRWDAPLRDINFWPILVYPLMYLDLQPHQFEDIVVKAFPVAKDWSRKISQALNLVKCILRYHPLERPSLEQMQNHVFFKDCEGEWLEGDPMWDEWRSFDVTVGPDVLLKETAECEQSPPPNSVPLEETVVCEPLQRHNSVPPEETVVHEPLQRPNSVPSEDTAEMEPSPRSNSVPPAETAERELSPHPNSVPPEETVEREPSTSPNSVPTEDKADSEPLPRPNSVPPEETGDREPSPHPNSVPLEKTAEREPSPCPNSVPPQKAAVLIPRRRAHLSYDIARVHSEPVINRAKISRAAACVQSDTVVALKEFRQSGKVYWDAHEGIFAVQPRKKKKGGLRGWMRKNFRGLLNCCSCLRGEQ